MYLFVHFIGFTFQTVSPQKPGEVNLILGAIDLNSSGRLAFFLFLSSLMPQFRWLHIIFVKQSTEVSSPYSVVVKEDKKLLTVLFPDGRDGRTFKVLDCQFLLFDLFFLLILLALVFSFFPFGSGYSSFLSFVVLVIPF